MMDEGVFIVFLGDSTERNLLGSWQDRWSGEMVWNLAGTLSLRETAMVIAFILQGK